MNAVANKLHMFLLVGALALAYGCVSGHPESQPANVAASTSVAPPLKVAVYADNGPSGIGAVEWFRLVNESPEMELHLVDGKMVRAGALNGMDVFVMPGGSSKTEFTTLGTNGVERMKEFLRGGGGYIGTCAGCCLLMDGEDRRARLMPWDRSGAVGDTLFPAFNLNAKGAKALGLKEGKHVMRYHGGPFLWPTTNVIADANMEIWGTFEAEGNMHGRVDQKKRMYGAGGIVGGTYGKGKVFVTSGHPEYFNFSLYVVEAAFKYVTGRKVTFPVRKRTPRALAVGFVSGGIYGVDTAQTALAIDAAEDMDLVLIDVAGIKERRLDHLDVLVLNNDTLAKYDVCMKAVADFAARGGKVVGFKAGKKLLPPGGVECGTKEDAVKTIRGLFPTK